MRRGDEEHVEGDQRRRGRGGERRGGDSGDGSKERQDERKRTAIYSCPIMARTETNLGQISRGK